MTADPDLFFDEERIAQAKAVCSDCPHIEACLAHALAHENHGVWAGTTPQERDCLRGARLVNTPEDARWADLLRARLNRGDAWAAIAEAEGVSLRTFERWVATDIALHDGAA